MLAFEKMKKADSLFAYTLKYQTLHDSLERIASDSRTEIVAMRLDNQENIHQIMALNKEKRRIALIRNFSILLTILLSIIGFLYLNRQKLKMHIKHQIALEEITKAEAEAEEAKRQLNTFTQNMLEKTNIIERLQEQLTKKEMNEQQIQYLQELTQHTILTDEDWHHFKKLFDNVYPGYLIELKLKVPDISLAELRIAALGKLQVTTKEAANLLGISPNSVTKTRQRLRNRLGVETDAELETFFG